MRIINQAGMYVPIKSWCENVEIGAVEQAKNLANLPFTYKHVALMPDTHQGYGMPIGGVLATKDVIIPNAVGVDIGCGMIAVQTNISELPIDTLKLIMGLIRDTIPVGFKHHDEQVPHTDMPYCYDHRSDLYPIVIQEYENARYQMGTLGGGNHFIEIQRGDDGMIWFMLHSGSRNLGFKVAQYYNDIAKELNRKWLSEVPKEWDLAFLPIDEAQEYLNEMEYCLEFAELNRKTMATRIKNIILSLIPNVEYTNEINIHHNYVALEHHFGKDVWVHRKGATSAKNGQMGIIPGSQGTSSYIVQGKGNRESFMSCSHGAGRKMGRMEAKRTLILEDELRILNDQGILHSIRGVDQLDEATGSYKDIITVMEEQKDLVDIVTKLEPLAVIKG